MTGAIRNSLKSVAAPGDQANLKCYEIRHPNSRMEMVAVTTDNSKRLPQNLGKRNRMLTECMVYQIILRQYPMSDVRTIKRIRRCDPKWLRGQG